MTTHVFLERTFDPPMTLPVLAEGVRDSAHCYALHRLNWNSSFLATDGRTMLCWLSAPDMESARVALRQTGADTRVLWRGTVHDAPSPCSPNTLVERSFETPVELEALQARENAGAWCLEAHRVRFSHTFFSNDRRRMLCFYEAPDAESVRLAQREAGMPFDAVWAFVRVTPQSIAALGR